MSYPYHIPNRRKVPRAGQPAYLALLVFVLIAIFCSSRCAAGSTQLSLSSASLSFGDIAVGSSSTLTETLTNTGTRSVSVSRAAVEGTGFSISGLRLPVTLTASESATFDVTFAPAATGSVTGTVSIRSSAHNLSLTISLSGTGVAGPSANLSATSLAFGSQAVGTASTVQTVTLSNTGSGALSITSLTVTGTNASNFAQTNTCGSSVAPGGTCTISVTFTPTASGSLTASVSITDNAAGSPQSVSLSGTGTGPAVGLSPTSLNFGTDPTAETTAAQIVTLTNTGSATLSISGISVSGTNSADFSEVANTCGGSLAAGSSCSISVAFTPSVDSANSDEVSATVP